MKLTTVLEALLRACRRWYQAGLVKRLPEIDTRNPPWHTDKTTAKTEKTKVQPRLVVRVLRSKKVVKVGDASADLIGVASESLQALDPHDRTREVPAAGL